jgi:putative component of membrane protein insertase Oxa1/YidC/SpoIIIJ protein YidD
MRALCLRLIAGYRQSELAARSAGCCRYSPSCSHYAEQVLATRTMPVALWLIVRRVLSCRRPMSRSTRRKVTSVLLLSGIVTLGSAGLAQAVAPTLVPPSLTRGGCNMALRGTDVGTFNRNNPLFVTKGKRITAEGLAPQAIRNKPEPAGSFTVIGIDLEVVSPLKASYKSEEHKGFRNFSTSVNVDDYLDLGSGLYRITIRATGSQPVGPGWACAATFYVKLDGSPVPGLVAGALGLAGLGAAATASGKSDWRPGDEVPAESGNDEIDLARTGSVDVVKQTVEPDPSGNRVKEAGALGCVLAIFAGVFGYEPGESAAVLAAGAGGAAPSEGRRIWRRGHLARGFFGGLTMGLGLTVFMQQRGYWLLTWVDVIAFPLALAVVLGWRGWKGKAFIVTSAAEAPAAVPAAAPQPSAVPETPIAPPAAPVEETPAVQEQVAEQPPAAWNPPPVEPPEAPDPPRS